MAPSGTLDCLAKRDFLASPKTSPEKLRAQAEAFLEAGQDYDALQFLVAAGETEKVAGMAQKAVKEGDLFLYLQTRRAQGQEPEPEELLKLSRAAEAKGLSRFAGQAEALASQNGPAQDGNDTDG